MRLLFEVLKFAFELVYASYQYEIQQAKEISHMETSPPEFEFVEEFAHEKDNNGELAEIS